MLLLSSSSSHHREQPKSQLAIHASRYSDFYKSHDRGNMITRSMEQLIIPQPSVPHRTTQERGHSTKRPASVANSHQNYFSTVGNLATKDLEVLTSPHLPLPFTITQSISTTTPSVAQQQFSNWSIPPQSTSIHSYSLPISVNNWGSSRQQCLYSYFFVVSKDILKNVNKKPTVQSKSKKQGNTFSENLLWRQTNPSFNWKTTNHWLQAGF